MIVEGWKTVVDEKGVAGNGMLGVSRCCDGLGFLWAGGWSSEDSPFVSLKTKKKKKLLTLVSSLRPLLSLKEATFVLFLFYLCSIFVLFLGIFG